MSGAIRRVALARRPAPRCSGSSRLRRDHRATESAHASRTRSRKDPPARAASSRCACANRYFRAIATVSPRSMLEASSSRSSVARSIAIARLVFPMPGAPRKTTLVEVGSSVGMASFTRCKSNGLSRRAHRYSGGSRSSNARVASRSCRARSAPSSLSRNVGRASSSIHAPVTTSVPLRRASTERRDPPAAVDSAASRAGAFARG